VFGYLGGVGEELLSERYQSCPAHEKAAAQQDATDT